MSLATTNNVVILNQASGYLQIDMLDALSTKYGKCVIIAGTIVERETKLSKSYIWHKIIEYNKTSAFKRIYTWLVATLQMFFIVLFKYRKAKIIAITNPPTAPLVPYLCRADYDVLVYDLYPDALVNFNYINEDGLLNRVFTFFTKRIFKRATNIFTLTPELAKETSKYTNSKEIKVVPIWTNNDFFTKIEKSHNKIYGKINFDQDDFIICYSGNLGRTHPVEKLVELAENSIAENLKFLIIGGGHKYELISNLINKKNLNNIMILPWQPIELLPHNIQVGDINVVTLDEGAADLSIPSKTFNLLSVGKPILAICSNKSALANLLHRYNCGEAFEPNNLEGITSFIKRLKTDKNEYNSYCKNAIEASKQFTKENAKLFL